MLLSVVIPIYNEEEALPYLLPALRKVLMEMPCTYEIVFVNDGSRDRSPELLERVAAEDVRVKVVSFSRNFGHQAAITAGMDFALGDAVVVMDADLQDPPEILKQMVEYFEQGYDVVSAQRVSRKTDSYFKRFTAAGFYWVMRHMVDSRLVPEVGDFRLFSREALIAICAFREQHRFMRGLVAWLGLKEAIVPFERQSRIAGETKYPLIKMLRFAWTAISSFSALPLRISMILGLVFCFAAFLYLAYSIYAALVLHAVVPGWASLVVLQCFFSGVTLFVLGLVGDYVAKIFEETKFRPLYVVNNAFNVVSRGERIERAVILNRCLEGFRAQVPQSGRHHC
jgi:dolichol-phosphate mannosyltransferase